MKKLLIFLILTVIMPVMATELTGKVINIVNGYIFELITDQDKLYVIRLYGVDAPSLGQLHGDEAKNYLGKLIYGQNIKVIYDRKDSWGYILGKVYVNDIYVNKEMVATGHAWWEEQYAGDDKELKAAEQEAKQNKLVVWSSSEDKPRKQDINDKSGLVGIYESDNDKSEENIGLTDDKGNVDIVKTFKTLKKEIDNETTEQGK